jgi:hypothetical protein
MWDKGIELAGRTVDVELFSDDDDDDEGQDVPDGATAFVNDIARFDALAREAMRANWHSDEFGARLYAEHHEDELGIEVAGDPDKLLARLFLKRIGFGSDDDPDRFVVLDYTIGEELTQYLMAVTFSRDGEITDVSMES